MDKVKSKYFDLHGGRGKERNILAKKEKSHD